MPNQSKKAQSKETQSKEIRKRKFLLYPGGSLNSIPELEEKLNFKFLPHIVFESLKEKRDIRARGLKKLANNEISQEALDLGNRFISNIDASYISNVSVRWINKEVEYGLFAEEDLDIGSYVGEYTGVVRKNDRRYSEPLNNYSYKYPVLDDNGRNFVIDATQGHLTRFINHSYAPNLKPIHVFHDGFFHLIFLVIQPIKKGSQLFYNYGSTYWYLRKKAQVL